MPLACAWDTVSNTTLSSRSSRSRPLAPHGFAFGGRTAQRVFSPTSSEQGHPCEGDETESASLQGRTSSRVRATPWRARRVAFVKHPRMSVFRCAQSAFGVRALGLPSAAGVISLGFAGAGFFPAYLSCGGGDSDLRMGSLRALPPTPHLLDVPCTGVARPRYALWFVCAAVARALVDDVDEEAQEDKAAAAPLQRVERVGRVAQHRVDLRSGGAALHASMKGLGTETRAPRRRATARAAARTVEKILRVVVTVVSTSGSNWVIV